MKSDRLSVTPAALAAAAAGDLANVMTAMRPGGIEAQEKAGQTTFVAGSTLPKDGLDRAAFEKMGFKFGEDVDTLFVSVTMPAGWQKQATSHSMHSDLLDDKRRTRASIFYKAAFYDRKAHIRLTRRYNESHYEPVNEKGEPAEPNKQSHYAVVVQDCGKEIKRFGLYERSDYPTCDALEKEAHAWLDANFPQHNDATAYWD